MTAGTTDNVTPDKSAVSAAPWLTNSAGPMSSDEIFPAVPLVSRSAVRGLGSSVLVHMILIVLLSLVVISQKEQPSSFVSRVQFDTTTGEQHALLVLPDPALPPRNTSTAADLFALNQTLAESAVAVPSLDWSAFSSGLSGAARRSGPMDEMAAGIQGRVAQAGGRTGEVQFSLAWHSLNDLDLHVIAPSGEHLSYGHRSSRCQGELDVDMNAMNRHGDRGDAISEEPVENVRWLEHGAPTGRYTVIVHQYRWANGRHSDPFQLLVNLGEHTRIIEDVIRAENPIVVFRFQYIGSSVPESRRNAFAGELSNLQQREEKQASALLNRALPMKPGPNRDELMSKIIRQFPHTDGAVEAMQKLKGKDKQVH